MAKRIDIVDIKSAVKAEQIEFYIADGDIYCRDRQTDERVIVGKEE